MATIRTGNRSALLIVDVQVGVVAAAGDISRQLDAIALAVRKARDAGVPVVWVQHDDEELPRGSAEWQWVLALVALVIVMAMNITSAVLFGELEYWFALIKVGAIVLFGILGIYFIVTQTPIDGHTPGFALIADNGGFFPNGIGAMFVIALGVVFAYGGTEMVGVAAGEFAIATAVAAVARKMAMHHSASTIITTVPL